MTAHVNDRYDLLLDRLARGPELPAVLHSHLDQVASVLRTRYADFGVDLDDPAQRAAVLVTLDSIAEIFMATEGPHFCIAHPSLVNLVGQRILAVRSIEDHHRKSTTA